MDPLTVQPSGIISQSPQINFLTQGVPPPSQLYIEQDADLLLRVAAPTIAQGFQVNFAVRTLQPNGKVKTHNFQVLVNATQVTLRRNLGECFIMGITASLLGAATAGRGQVFVKASIVRGIAGTEFFYWTLLSDYVTTNYHPTWPNAVLKSPLEGPGFLRVIVGTDPAVGLEFTETVPALTRWRLQGIRNTLATSAAVANRVPTFIFDDGANFYWQTAASAFQTATLSWAYAIGSLGGQGAVVNSFATVQTPIPTMMLAGHRFRSSTVNIDAGDNWGPPVYLVEEWVDI